MAEKKMVGYYAYVPRTDIFSNFEMPSPLGVRIESRGYGEQASYQVDRGPQTIKFTNGYFETDNSELIKILDQMCIGARFELPNGRMWEPYVIVTIRKEPILPAQNIKTVTNTVEKLVLPENFVTEMTNAQLKTFVNKVGLEMKETLTNADMVDLLRDNGNII